MSLLLSFIARLRWAFSAALRAPATRAATRAAAARVAGPLGPAVTAIPPRLPGSTTHPHHAPRGLWRVRVVDPGRWSVGEAGPSGPRSGGEGQAFPVTGDGPGQMCRVMSTSTPSSACVTPTVFSLPPKSPNDSATQSATSGGSAAKACCRESRFPVARTSGSPRTTSSGSSPEAAPSVPELPSLASHGSRASRRRVPASASRSDR